MGPSNEAGGPQSGPLSDALFANTAPHWEGRARITTSAASRDVGATSAPVEIRVPALTPTSPFTTWDP
jgi:hypothetical protein